MDAPPDPPIDGDLPLGGDRGAVPADARTPEQVRRAQRLESLGRLAGGIAHDFNNVLGVILGYVELAKMGLREVDPKVVRHLELALSTLGRARQLADRLLDVSREEPRAADVCDLNEAVQQVRELLGETLDRRIQFEVRLGADLPPSPMGIDELRQVVINLCLNAAEAMSEGGHLTIETSRAEVPPGGARPAGSYVVLRVRDSGPGIPRELRERVFDPWFTTRSSRSGLGLWVSRSLVERYGGSIEAAGDARGAALTVWLPSECAVAAAPGPDRPPPSAADAADVLIVDDEPGVRDVTRAFLEMDGYRVLEAGTGAEALRTLRERPGGVRVVFLDHVLPDARGADLAWQIDALVPAPRLVMVSGLAGDPGVGALPEGTRLLPKPYLRADVTRLLRDDLGIVPG